MNINQPRRSQQASSTGGSPAVEETAAHTESLRKRAAFFYFTLENTLTETSSSSWLELKPGAEPTDSSLSPPRSPAFPSDFNSSERSSDGDVSRVGSSDRSHQTVCRGPARRGLKLPGCKQTLNLLHSVWSDKQQKPFPPPEFNLLHQSTKTWRNRTSGTSLDDNLLTICEFIPLFMHLRATLDQKTKSSNHTKKLILFYF